MKKILAYSAMCATLVAASSCGGGEKNEVVEPVEEATVWSDVNTMDTNGEMTGSEVTNYGANGQIVSVDKFAVDKTSKESVKTEHIIYQNGKPALGKYLKEDGTVEGKDVYTYNEQGALSVMENSTYSEALQRIAPSMRYLYTYDANGNVTSVKEQKSTPRGWVNAYEWTYEYDPNGRLAVRADFTGDEKNKDRKQSCKYMWEYSDDNKITKHDYFTFDLKMGKLKHDSKYQYKYNDAGQIVEILVIRHKSNAKRDDINSRLFKFEYNKLGQQTVIFEQKWNNGTSSWYEVSSGSKEYDANGQLVKATSVKNTNKGTKFYNEVHTFNGTPTQPLVAPVTPGYIVKPEIDLSDKHLTSKEEE